ncbi:alcohol dehydrogenase catalytic domain-containing protein [Streptomyces hoynatensis]|uniref:alcohol dehydrogenase catalytic domain-containing protein n=1 Tax=Streptomyces hoynatensis TaxID=1141874 RepID=UPI001319E78D|nr:zinc-binding dehydrogenase [Streptomyces hoynatensis]
MRAAWYERQGPAGRVLTVGELPDPVPVAGEVRVRLAAAGVNAADVDRRSGRDGRPMREPLVVPGQDGAGVVDLVGPGVPKARLGERVWVYFAARGKAFGTSAEYVVVPAAQAVPLPEAASFETGAALGLPALAAHHALFCAGQVRGRAVLVPGGGRAAGRCAVELAARAGALVLATAAGEEERRAARRSGADHVLEEGDGEPGRLARAVLGLVPGGVDLVVDAALGDHLPWAAAVLARRGTLVGHGPGSLPEPALPLAELRARQATLRLLDVLETPPGELRAAVAHLGRLLAAGALAQPIAARHPLAAAAAAHEEVERGAGLGAVLLLPRAGATDEGEGGGSGGAPGAGPGAGAGEGPKAWNRPPEAGREPGPRP